MVLVLSGTGGSGTIEEREVATGTANDFDISVTSGLEDGDRVISNPQKYREKVGSTAKIELTPKGA